MPLPGAGSGHDASATWSIACSGTRLGRAPSAAERAVAEAAIADPRAAGKASPDAVADLLWAVLMKPEFQLIY